MGHLRTPAKGPVKQQSPSDLVVSCVNKHLCHPRSSTIRPTLVLQRLCMQVQVAAGLEDPCVPRGEGQIYCYLHVPRTAACLNGNLCFVCSTCDTAMDLLSAHATRLAPEQARLAPTAPRCVATGAWDKWLADHDVAVLAAWCHLLLVPTSVRKVSLVQYWARCRRWRSCYRRLMHRAHAPADSYNPEPLRAHRSCMVSDQCVCTHQIPTHWNSRCTIDCVDDRLC